MTETTQDDLQPGISIALKLDKESIEERLNIPLDRKYKIAQWDWIFEQLLPLILAEDRNIYQKAIRHLRDALDSERWQAVKKSKSGQKRLEQRLKKICKIVEIAAQKEPNVFEEFCKTFKLDITLPLSRDFILGWLERLSQSQPQTRLSKNDILAARILFDGFGLTWQEAGEKLIETLDFPDLNVRACAAYKLGKFASLLSCDLLEVGSYTQYCAEVDSEEDGTWKWFFEAGVYENYEDYLSSALGTPPLSEFIESIAQKEIERSGIASAFLNGLGDIARHNSDWILDVLENYPKSKIAGSYFLYDLKLDACEFLSRDVSVIRRLIDMGRTDIAVKMATDEKIKREEIEPLLIEMGYDENDEIVACVSSHLAAHHHYFHPQGAALGCVEKIEDLPEVEIFLLFQHSFLWVLDWEELESPDVAIIYPKERGETLSRSDARKWCDIIFPKSVRGSVETESQRLSSQYRYYENGYVDYKEADGGQSKAIERVIINYQSDALWNPKQLLESFRSS